MAARKAKGAVAHKVTAPLIQAVVNGQVIHFRAGDVLPEDVDEKSLDNLKSLGFVSEEDAPTEPDEK